MIETERLRIRRFTLKDAPFVIELINMPSWLEFIGDRGVRTVDDAEIYILNNSLRSYEQFGFGPYLVELKDTQISIGLCGLHRRPAMDDIDIGFALLPDYAGKGYGYEAATAVIAHAQDVLGLTRITGITKPTNVPSIRLLEKLGLQFEKKIRFGANKEDSLLFGKTLRPATVSPFPAATL